MSQADTPNQSQTGATTAAVNQVYVPQGWCGPTYQPGTLVWHGCHPYQVTGVAPNHNWEYWSYTVQPVGHNQKPDYMENIQGYLLEHQLGAERPHYGEDSEAPTHETGSLGYSEASGVQD